MYWTALDCSDFGSHALKMAEPLLVWVLAQLLEDELPIDLERFPLAAEREINVCALHATLLVDIFSAAAHLVY